MPEPPAPCVICGAEPDAITRFVLVMLTDRYQLRFCESCIRLLYLMVVEVRHRHEA